MAFFPTIDKLEDSGTLFMEISPSYQGYYAQLPITLPVDKYQPHMKQMAMAWAAADSAVHKILHPGTKISEVYNILIDTVKSKSFQSPLRPGHSIGLDILDYWSITDTNETIIKPGMILAIHPCVMVKPGGDGVGMGYTYLITPTGYERFSKVDLAKELGLI
jgi:Xaa-Pro dipeptidase